MKTYYVSYMVIYGDEVEAESPKAAADKVASECPYDVSSPAFVWDDEGNTWDEEKEELPDKDVEE